MRHLFRTTVILSLVSLSVSGRAQADSWRIGADLGTGISFMRNEDSLTPLLHPSPGVSLALLASHDEFPGLEGSVGLRMYRFSAESLPDSEQLVSLNYVTLGAAHTLKQWDRLSIVGSGALLVPTSTETSGELDRETRDQLAGTQTSLALSLGGRYGFDLGTLQNALNLRVEVAPVHVIADSKAVLESYWLTWAIFFN